MRRGAAVALGNASLGSVRPGCSAAKRRPACSATSVSVPCTRARAHPPPLPARLAPQSTSRGSGRRPSSRRARARPTGAPVAPIAVTPRRHRAFYNRHWSVAAPPPLPARRSPAASRPPRLAPFPEPPSPVQDEVVGLLRLLRRPRLGAQPLPPNEHKLVRLLVRLLFGRGEIAQRAGPLRARRRGQDMWGVRFADRSNSALCSPHLTLAAHRSSTPLTFDSHPFALTLIPQPSSPLNPQVAPRPSLSVLCPTFSPMVFSLGQSSSTNPSTPSVLHQHTPLALHQHSTSCTRTRTHNYLWYIEASARVRALEIVCLPPLLHLPPPLPHPKGCGGGGFCCVRVAVSSGTCKPTNYHRPFTLPGRTEGRAGGRPHTKTTPTQ